MTTIGLSLFLRFAEGCRLYLEKNSLISDEDNRVIKSGKPSDEVLKRVFFVAYPGLMGVKERLGKKDMFEADVVREFYSFDHNKRKIEQGDRFCLAYPAKVMENHSVLAGVHYLPFGKHRELFGKLLFPGELFQSG